MKCLGFLSLLLLPALADDTAKRRFNLPANDAAITLKLFIEQSDLEIIYPTEAVRGIQTKAVSGEMTAKEALNRMLSDTGLQITQGKSGMMTVSRGTAPNGPRAAQPVPPSATARSVNEAGARMRLESSVEPKAAAGADVFELSPFVVNAEADNGYVATSTLAGTRLRKDLKDVAASISVITKDFMNDVAANNLEELLVYTLGSEVAGIGGNFGGAQADFANAFVNFDDVNHEPSAIIRLRSLSVGGISGRADVTRDYFLTDIPNDSYNLDRVEVTRGPNSMLFGLGSPAGLVNNSLARANPQRNSTRLGTQISSYDSYRANLDHNQVLIKDRLALRLAGLYSDTRYEQRHSYAINRRIYGALTYRPFKSTTLRLNGELANNKNNRPELRPPFDAYSFWWAIGKPIYDPITGQVSYLGTRPTDPGLQASNANGTPNANLLAGMGSNGINLVNDNPNVFAPYGIEILQLRSVVAANGTLANNGQFRRTNFSHNYLRELLSPGLDTANPSYNFWKLPQITDTNVFNYFENSLEGPSKYEDVRWRSFNVTLEQRLGRHAGFEISYDKQSLDNTWQNLSTFNSYNLTIDLNTRMLDGTPNPNFGRLMWNDVGFNASDNRDREAARFSAYYELDLKKRFATGSKLGRFLGRHIFNASYTNQANTYQLMRGRAFYAGLDYYAAKTVTDTGLSITNNSQLMRIPVQFYLGDSVLGLNGPEQVRAQGLGVNLLMENQETITTSYYNTPAAGSTTLGTWTTRTFSFRAPEHWDKTSVALLAARTGQRYKSKVLVSDNYWFDDLLVTTVGWRRDEYRTSDAGAPTFGPDGIFLTDPAVWYRQLKLDAAQEKINYSAVLHSPGFIKRRLPLGAEVSLTYNQSSNARPGPQRKSVLGAALDPESGETQDYGALITLLGGKLNLRIGYYHTVAAGTSNSQINTFNLAGAYTTTADRLIKGELDEYPDGTPTTAAKAAFLAFINSPATADWNRAIAFTPTATGARSSIVAENVAVTSDLDAKGWEYELTANPTKNWRISANYATSGTILTNSGTDIKTLLDAWRPIIMDGPAGTLPIAEGSTTQFRDSFLAQDISINRVRRLDGSVAPEQRRWRFNLTNTYTFNQGRLKGFRVGGSVRLQAKAAIGYPVILIDGAGQYDVTKPYYGPKEENYDAWIGYSRKILKNKVRWSTQLNVRNIGQKNKLIPAAAQPDGSIAAWRIVASQSWTLSNSFEF